MGLEAAGARRLAPTVSVVVPAYNIQEFIVDCINSLEAQTFENLEIIAVDDGSTDRTGELLDQLRSRSDSRLRVIHQINGGLSDARNAGLDAALGDLTVFVDGDDSVSPHFVSSLVCALDSSEADVATCDYVRYVPGHRLEWGPPPESAKVMAGEHALAETLYFRGAGTRAWGKLASTEMWRRHLFPEGLVYEDLATVPGLMAEASAVVCIDEPLYGFLVRPGSITRQSDLPPQRVRDLATAITAGCAPAAGSRPQLVRAFEARRAVELTRMIGLRDLVSDPRALATEFSRASADLRKLAGRVLVDRRAPLWLRLRVLLAAVAPVVYLALWRSRKRAEGWA